MQDVDPLAQLACLRVPEPHPVAHLTDGLRVIDPESSLPGARTVAGDLGVMDVAVFARRRSPRCWPAW
jgi:hypothetical protein